MKIRQEEPEDRRAEERTESFSLFGRESIFSTSAGGRNKLLGMKWFLVTLVGVILNTLGLYFFAGAVVRRTMEAGAASGMMDSLLGFVLINAGILLMIAGMGGRRRGD